MELSHQLYSFVADDDENIHIDSVALRAWCLKAKLVVHSTPVRIELFPQFLRDNVVSKERLQELMKRDHSEPIIFCDDGTKDHRGNPNVLLVDGHHRYALACIKRQIFIDCWIISKLLWAPFKVELPGKLTQEQLRALPIVRRDY